MDIGKIPKELAKQAKEMGLEIVKPASKEGIRKVAIGACAGGAISPFYSRGFDWLWSKLPFDNKIAYYITKIGTPLAISAIALKTKVPGGNIIAGVPVGISIYSAVKALLSGAFSLKKSVSSAESTETKEEVELWGAW